MRMPEVSYDITQLRGGFDQVTPTLSLKPGVVRDGVNFECSTNGGYARIAGYERYDGHAKPSDALYQTIQVASFTNTPTVGQTLTGFTSAATGTIIVVAANYVVLTQVSGTFAVGETVKVGGTTIGVMANFTATVTSKQYAQYQNLAADVYRALISQVPGSGPVRGVAGLVVGGVDKLYAFRNNVGATSCDLYEATSGGWSQINYKRKVFFSTGAVAIPADGATLTQGLVSATVYRVMASSGSTTWGGDTAGKFIIGTPSGGAGVFAAGAATLTGGATCLLIDADTPVTMSPGGKFEFSTGNFTGSLGTLRLYGADGVNKMFEFDGTTLAPIETGAATDTPKHIVVHKNYLVASISSSVFISGPGYPYRYLAADLAAEIAIGDSVSALLVQPGAQTTAALAIYGASSTYMLYGTSSITWNLVAFNTGTGAIDYSGQNMAQSYVLDDPGVLALSTSLNYGNFQSSTLTSNILPFITAERSKLSYASLNRQKNQYRLFFNDGYGLYLTIANGKMLGAMPVLFPDPAYCAWEGMLTTGDAVSYFGSLDDGYVYQMDKGSSFDGENIDAYITLNWNACGSPRLLKRFRHASIEMQGNYYAEIYFGYQLGYGTTEITQPTPTLYPSGFSGAPPWDTFVWDNFTWDGRTLFPTEVDVRGTAENIQVTISSTNDYIYPYTVNSVINHYTKRRGLR